MWKTKTLIYLIILNLIGAGIIAYLYIQESKVQLSESYAIQIKEKGGIGNYLVDSKGKALYYFAEDEPGKSNCKAQCLDSWPIFYASEDMKISPNLNKADFETIERKDAKNDNQTTYKGWPLYHYKEDRYAGDIHGEGILNIWHAAKVPFYTIIIRSGEKTGKYLADIKGMTIYYHKNDSPLKSNCTGQCLNDWPVFYTEYIVTPSTLDASDFGTILRKDGKKQTTFKGWPLYYSVQDTGSGDIMGQENEDWSILNPTSFNQ